MTEVVESEGQCRGCGETAVLGDGFCNKCWDKVKHKRQLLLAKEASPAIPKSKKYPPAETTPEPPATYYVMHKGELVEATAGEFMAVITNVRYYK